MAARQTERCEAMAAFQSTVLENRDSADLISKSLSRLSGVNGWEINFVTDIIHVNYDPTETSREAIREAIGIHAGSESSKSDLREPDSG